MHQDQKNEEQETFEARLNKAQGYRKLGKKSANSSSSMQGKALHLAIEIVSGPLLGVLVGLGMDNLFDTKPLFMIIFFFLGAAGAMLRVYRIAIKSEQEQQQLYQESQAENGHNTDEPFNR